MAAIGVAPARAVESLDDDMLAKKFANRNTRAIFEELYRRHKGQIYHTCISYVRNPDDAEDMVAQTFFKAWRARKSFRGDSKFSTWLTRIAVNECLMYIRHDKAYGKGAATVVSLDVPLANAEGDDFLMLDVPVDDLSIKGHADRQCIAKIMAGMPSIYKTVFHLYFWKQYSIADIQKELKLTEPTVKSRILRGRNFFKKRLRAIDRLDTQEMT